MKQALVMTHSSTQLTGPSLTIQSNAAIAGRMLGSRWNRWPFFFLVVFVVLVIARVGNGTSIMLLLQAGVLPFSFEEARKLFEFPAVNGNRFLTTPLYNLPPVDAFLFLNLTIWASYEECIKMKTELVLKTPPFICMAPLLIFEGFTGDSSPRKGWSFLGKNSRSHFLLASKPSFRWPWGRGNCWQQINLG